MTRIFFFFCLFWAGVATSRGQNVHLDRYYPAINRAELAIVRGDHAAAGQFYATAFAAAGRGFSRDLHNAAVCAIYQQEPKRAVEYLRQLALNGAGRAYFNDTVFTALHGHRAWKRFLLDYDDLRRRHLQASNQTLRRELLELDSLDQVLRRQDPRYERLGDSIDRFDAENIRRFTALVLAHGFPGEALVGAAFPGEVPASIVLHHHAQKLSQRDNDKYRSLPSQIPVLAEAARTGRLEPGVAAYLIEMQNDPAWHLNAHAFIRIRVDGALRPYLLISPVADEQRESVEERRAALGLEPLDDYYQKGLFRVKHPDTPFKFGNATGLHIFDGDAEMEAFFLSVMKKIDL